MSDWEDVGRNVKFRVEGKKLTIEVDLSRRFGRTKKGTGDNEIIASSDGAKEIKPKSKAYIGLNVWCAPPRKQGRD
jgi:hypothetical protein